MDSLVKGCESMLTLKDVGILTDKSEGFIKSKIANGVLIKYDKFGKPLADPIKYKGFFKIPDVKKVFNIDPDLKKLDQPNYNNKCEYEEKDICPKEIIKIAQPDLCEKLESLNDKRFDVCIAAFDINPKEFPVPFKLENNSETHRKFEETYSIIERMSNLLTDNGSLLIYDTPRRLPYYAVRLAHKLVFKYWIAIHTFDIRGEGMFNPATTGILFMVNKNERFVINTIREPHKKCRYCKEILKDYGGKKHLMHKKGAALSDVWKFMEIGHQGIHETHKISKAVLERVINLTCTNNSSVLLASLNEKNKL